LEAVPSCPITSNNGVNYNNMSQKVAKMNCVKSRNPDITRIDDGTDTVTERTVIDDQGRERTLVTVVSRYGARITGKTGKRLLKIFGNDIATTAQ
jgi:hypothetical protein